MFSFFYVPESALACLPFNPSFTSLSKSHLKYFSGTRHILAVFIIHNTLCLFVYMYSTCICLFILGRKKRAATLAECEAACSISPTDVRPYCTEDCFVTGDPSVSDLI